MQTDTDDEEIVFMHPNQFLSIWLTEVLDAVHRNAPAILIVEMIERQAREILESAKERRPMTLNLDELADYDLARRH